jgi:hypothetical protein
VLKSKSITFHVQVVTFIFLGEFYSASQEFVQVVMGLVIGNLICQILLGLLPAACEVSMDEFLQFLYLEMARDIEEARQFIIFEDFSFIEHQMKLRCV